MIKKNILRRILYTGVGLVILVAVLLTFIVIPCFFLDKPTNATPVIGGNPCWPDT